MLRFLAAMVLLLTFPAAATAELRLAHVFQENMVLQRDMKTPVWGWADPKATVTVAFAGQSKQVTANDKGYWIAELEPLKTSAQGQVLSVSSGGSKIDCKNVLVGEVWVLSGQSNMARPLRNESLDYPWYKDYYNDAEYPQIRFITYGMGASSTPLEEIEVPARKTQKWQAMTKATSQHVMSIGFFFSKRISRELNTPIGLVQVAVSGTPQSAWIAKETLESFPGENGKPNYYQSLLGSAEAKLATAAKGTVKSFDAFEAALATWRKDPAATERSWPGDAVITDYPSVLYNARVHPLAPLAFRGMLWHQGEAGPGGAYGKRMLASIKQHRQLFKHDFHFIFGTLTRKTMLPPPMEPMVTNFGQINHSMIEGDQLFGETGTLVNFFDLGNPWTHWANKEEAGRRMALAALDRVYGKKQVFTGPQLIESKVAGATVTCKFRHVGGGIKHQPSIDNISGVVIVDKKGNHFWADVKVAGNDTLVFSHPKVTDAAAVFYGCHTNPHETIFNAEGFAAFQFTAGNAPPVKGKDESPLISVVSSDKPKVDLHIYHVRQDGYVLTALESKTPPAGNVKIKAYVPSTWKDVAVEVGDKTVDSGNPVTEKGKKYIQVDVPINGPRVVISNAAHDSQPLRNARRP
jgi:sialate O-acetylesterase